MKIKEHLKNLQKLIPNNLLLYFQNLHSTLLSKWIVSLGSQPLEFNHKSAMVFSPHQDDETLGCGGMIALKREQGIRVAVTFLTDGRGNSGIKPRSQQETIQIRKQEAVTALKILGVNTTDIHFLEQPDGTLQSLLKEERKQLVDKLAELIITYQPQEVYVPHRKDCHRDHEATYELVKAAMVQARVKVDLLQYPIWLMWRAPLFIILKLADISPAYRLSIQGVQDKKYRAISSYKSQIESLPPNFVKQFLEANEVFFKAKF